MITKKYQLKSLEGNFIIDFEVSSNRLNKWNKEVISQQDIINRIVSFGYNPLLYTWNEK